VEEIVAVMQAAGDGAEGIRLRGIIVVLWRAGLRISEALGLNETDLDPDRGSLVVRHGKGDRRRGGRDRPLGMDPPRLVARASKDPAGWETVLRCARADMRPALRAGWNPRPTPPRC
jgi:integrase